MHNYGAELKYQRELAGLNQPELAIKIGTSQANISRWERGEVLPNIDFCVQLANCFGITLEELLGIEYKFGVKIITPAPNVRSEDYSSEERQLINDYQKLNSRSKKYLQDTIKMLLESASGSEKKKNL